MSPRPDHPASLPTNPPTSPGTRTRTLPAALAIACLLLTGCKDQRPAEPIVDLSAIVVSA